VLDAGRDGVGHDLLAVEVETVVGEVEADVDEGRWQGHAVRAVITFAVFRD